MIATKEIINTSKYTNIEYNTKYVKYYKAMTPSHENQIIGHIKKSYY